MKSILAGLLLFAALGRAQVITTLAGADWLFPGDGRTATDAPLAGADSLSIAVDPNGGLLIADAGNQMVMRVASDGVLRVVAGNGFAAWSGDGGPAVDAALAFPAGVALDRAGNIYVTVYHRIRRIRPDGIIETVAGTGEAGFSGDGGPAIAAQFNFPTGIAVDAQDNIYVADTANNRIRKITPDGMVATVAGDGNAALVGEGVPATQASLNYPYGVAVDGSGNLYIADTFNNAVRMVDQAGLIWLVAIGVYPNTLFPFGITVDPNGVPWFAGQLTYQGVDYELVATIGGDGTPLAVIASPAGFSGDGGSFLTAALHRPTGLAFDPQGNLYIADTGNSRIRKVTWTAADGIVSTVAGNNLFRYNGENVPALTAPLDSPIGVAVDPAGNVYLSEIFRARVRKVGREDGLVSTFAGGQEGFFGDGGAAAGAGLTYPTGLAADSLGNVFIADQLNSRVRKVAPGGTITTVAGNGHHDYSGDGGPATAAALQFPEAVAADGGGNLYIADTSNNRVRKVSALGTISTLAGNGQAAYSGDGSAASRAGLSGPRGVAAAPDGSVYIADTENSVIRKVTPDGSIRTVAGNGMPGFGGDGGFATAASLNRPGGLALDGAGNLYIADTDNHRIRVLSPDGVIVTVAGNGRSGYRGDGGSPTAARLSYPSAVAVDSGGNLYIADEINNRVRVVFVAPPSFQVVPARLEFAAESGGPAAPVQRLALAGGVAGIPFTVTASAEWLASGVAEAFMPAPTEITANPGALAPGTYEGTVTVTAPLAMPPVVEVPVTFTVWEAKPPRLAARPDALAFPLVEGAGPATQTLRVANDGGGTVDFTVESGATWLKVAPETGTAAAYGATALTVTADPAGLAAGTYSTRLSVAGGDGEAGSVAVVMTVSAVKQSILLPQAGLTFTAVEGGGGTAPLGVAVVNTGQGVMSWTAGPAVAQDGPAWLAVDPASGSSDAAGGVTQAVVSVNPAGLAAGVYYGQVRIAAPEADNSPQSVTVVLNVLPAGSDPGPIIQPGGLVFTAQAGGASPGSLPVLVSNLAATEATFSSGRLTQDGGSWLASLPASGTVAPGGNARLVVQPDITGLEAGVYRGTITLQFAGGVSRGVDVLLVVRPAPGATAALNRRRSAGACLPSKLYPVFTSLGLDSGVPVGWPNQMVVRVVDDCANAMREGSVVVDFSTGDPQLSLTSARDGNWLGVWQVRNTPLSQVTLKVSAEQPEGRLRGSAQVTGGLKANQDPPVLDAAAVVSSASMLPQAPVAPGTMISIFGSRLADGDATASGASLPNEIGGTVVALAGVPLPLVSVSESRIDALVPYDVAVNTRLQMIVRRGASFTVPELVTVAPAQPAVFTSDRTGKGQGQIFGTAGDGTVFLAGPGHPVKAGDEIVLYSTGLGAVDPPLPAGTPVPEESASETVNPVTLNIGGVDAPVSFAGLLPGLTGIYQVKARVPDGTGSGDAVPVVLTTLGQASPVVTMAVE